MPSGEPPEKTQALVKFTKPELPAKWDYDESVARVKPMFYKWRRMTGEMFQELYVARDNLLSQGRRTDLTSRNFPKSWADYCLEIGISRSTADKWLAAAYGKKDGTGHVALPIDTRGIEIRRQDFRELLSSLSDVDAIITDPPYGQEYIPLYGELARLARLALTPEGVLAVMCGQSYLPEILPMMSAEIPYRWMLAYLTPGGQSPQIWPRKINTFWKPILLFGKGERWISDVIHSDVNDNDKRFHEWGQSESGMGRLVDRLTELGSLVCDPFAGGGTTGVVCQRLGRRFIGGDLNG